MDLEVNMAKTAKEQPQKRDSFHNGQLWLDNNGVHINAQGGCVLFHEGVYYWYGEHKVAGEAGNFAHVGVHVYSSYDLYNWHDSGIALAVSDDSESDIVKGCIIERPKIVFNSRTKQFVMWFHLELVGHERRAARCGVAISDHPIGPYKFLYSFRPDGNQSRDQTLFIDDDGAAYHFYATNHNELLHISRLTDDYLRPSGKFVKAFEGRRMEAMTICKFKNKYYFLASGCSGWAPNAARSAVASNILGPWHELGNPCVGVNPINKLGAEKTFGGQSTCIFKVAGRENAFIAMFSLWNPINFIDGRYIWLPMEFIEDRFIVKWHSKWSLDLFD